MIVNPIRPPTTDLTDTQLQQFAAQLTQQRHFRVEQLSTMDGLAPHTAPRPVTPADLEVIDTVRRGARQALNEIEAALSRMAEGSYGRCIDCAQRLPVERLEVLPHVARCMSCQRAVDAP